MHPAAPPPARPCLQVLCAFVAEDQAKQEWLAAMGVLPLLERLCLDTQPVQSLRATAAATAAAAAVAAGGRQAPAGAAPGTAGAAAAAAAAVPGGGKASWGDWLGGLWAGAARSGPSAAAGGDGSRGGAGGAAQQQAAVAAAAAGGELRAAGIDAVAAVTAAAEQADHGAPVGGAAGAEEVQAGLPLLCLQRQAARLLSMLCLQPQLAASVAGGPWQLWLQAAAGSDDCRLASHASKALLHAQAAAAAAAGQLRAPSPAAVVIRSLLPWRRARQGQLHVTYHDGLHLFNPESPHHAALVAPPHASGLLQDAAELLADVSAAAEAAVAAAAAADVAGGVVSDPWDMQDAALSLAAYDAYTAQQLRRQHPPRQVPAARGGAAAAPRQEVGVGAADGSAVVRLVGGGKAGARGAAASGQLPDADVAGGPVVTSSSGPVPAAAAARQLPDADIVFLHGIRGGPFITWRHGGPLGNSPIARELSRSDCWPAAWLSKDLPNARLISVEYQVGWAGAVGWAGGLGWHRELISVERC
jgi:hypothetical protein